MALSWALDTSYPFFRSSCDDVGRQKAWWITTEPKYHAIKLVSWKNCTGNAHLCEKSPLVSRLNALGGCFKLCLFTSCAHIMDMSNTNEHFGHVTSDIRLSMVCLSRSLPFTTISHPQPSLIFFFYVVKSK
jgi:hypothetical protein